MKQVRQPHKEGSWWWDHGGAVAMGLPGLQCVFASSASPAVSLSDGRLCRTTRDSPCPAVLSKNGLVKERPIHLPRRPTRFCGRCGVGGVHRDPHGLFTPPVSGAVDVADIAAAGAGVCNTAAAHPVDCWRRRIKRAYVACETRHLAGRFFD